MQTIRKSENEAISIGKQLRERRLQLGLTLMELGELTSVNFGQLSRFEQGQFKLISRNLQIVLKNLQVNGSIRTGRVDPVARFRSLLGRSKRHESAAHALLAALEDLR